MSQIEKSRVFSFRVGINETILQINKKLEQIKESISDFQHQSENRNVVQYCDNKRHKILVVQLKAPISHKCPFCESIMTFGVYSTKKADFTLTENDRHSEYLVEAYKRNE